MNGDSVEYCLFETCSVWLEKFQSHVKFTSSRRYQRWYASTDRGSKVPTSPATHSRLPHHLLPLPIPFSRPSRIICCPFLNRLVPLPGTSYCLLLGPVAFTPAPRTIYSRLTYCSLSSRTVYICFPYGSLSLPVLFTLPSSAIYNPLPCCFLPLPVPFTPASRATECRLSHCLLPLPVPFTRAFRTVYYRSPHHLTPGSLTVYQTSICCMKILTQNMTITAFNFTFQLHLQGQVLFNLYIPTQTDQIRIRKQTTCVSAEYKCSDSVYFSVIDTCG